ncbi:hypothetical protein C5167_011929 [Papaver somniferum]|uniref:Uncharacterized protein n=1 Tax=Papaver somniferum TaxID=3469 RepID=A0A4Y7IZZ0_PAPSO|nr:late embryogenesis abundant protein Lea5-like [Papaver somniferum]RZC53069.1 hypothetical protein C5167_011929 [Papaver somniferum]
MAGSLSNTKLVLTALADGISLSINRSRGITSVSTQAVGSTVVKGEKVVKKPSPGGAVTEVSPWIPDAVTGYYRPENHANDIDVAELRDTLLNQKTNHH